MTIVSRGFVVGSMEPQHVFSRRFLLNSTLWIRFGYFGPPFCCWVISLLPFAFVREFVQRQREVPQADLELRVLLAEHQNVVLLEVGELGLDGCPHGPHADVGAAARVGRHRLDNRILTDWQQT